MGTQQPLSTTSTTEPERGEAHGECEAIAKYGAAFPRSPQAPRGASPTSICVATPQAMGRKRCTHDSPVVCDMKEEATDDNVTNDM